MPEDVLERLEAGEPPSLYRGWVALHDGRAVQGILFPRHLPKAFTTTSLPTAAGETISPVDDRTVRTDRHARDVVSIFNDQPTAGPQGADQPKEYLVALRHVLKHQPHMHQVETGDFEGIVHDVVLPNFHLGVFAGVEVARVDLRRYYAPTRYDTLG